MAYSPDVQTTTVITTILTNILVGGVLYYLFERYRGIREIYLARMRNPQNSTPGQLDQDFGSWITFIGKVSDKETLEHIGKLTSLSPLPLLLSCSKNSSKDSRIGCFYFLKIPSLLYSN